MKLVNLLNACNEIAPKKDVRYYFNGVCVYVHADRIAHVAATDGHRLILLTLDQSVRLSDCQTLILSKSDIEIMNIRYSYLEHDAINVIDVVRENCEFIDARYPDINRVIPDSKRNVKIDNGIAFNIEYIASLEKICKKLFKGLKIDVNKKAFNFQFGNVTESVVISRVYVDITVKYVVMPTKL